MFQLVVDPFKKLSEYLTRPSESFQNPNLSARSFFFFFYHYIHQRWHLPLSQNTASFLQATHHNFDLKAASADTCDLFLFVRSALGFSECHRVFCLSSYNIPVFFWLCLKEGNFNKA